MAQNDVWLLVGVFAVSIPLVALARRLNVAYPIVLVLAGLVLGFIPGLPETALPPDLVLVIFLPPLLYWEAVTAPTDVMRANASQIGLLAIGLVVATTIAVAVVAHAAIPPLGWAMAFVLGAIVAPTDELASAPVLERMRMPRHLIAIVQGESLLNDASSLILYSAALTVVVSGVFNPALDSLNFAIAGVGGIALGLIVGRVAIAGWRRIRDADLQAAISFNVPYLAYLLAGRFGLSGVLAVVFAGGFVNIYTPEVITPRARLQATGYWDTVVFLANALLFLLLGFQLHAIVARVLQEYTLPAILWYAVVVNVTVIGTRFAWVMAQEFVPRIGGAYEHPEGDWKHAVIAAWSGLRGAVSLAAALAIPMTVASGAHLAHRNLVIFLTFSVILVTLVGGGLTLPLLIERLGVAEDTTEEDADLRRAVKEMSRAALSELDRLEGSFGAPPDHVQRIRRHYEDRRDHIAGHPADERRGFAIEKRLLDVEREALIAMRRRGEIDNTVMRRLIRELDIAEERLQDSAR